MSQGPALPPTGAGEEHYGGAWGEGRAEYATSTDLGPRAPGAHQLQHEPHASGSIICNVEFETTAQN